MPLSPSFQRSRQWRMSSFVVPGSRPMNVYGKLLPVEVVLRREIVGFRLALLADFARHASSIWCMWCGIGPRLSKNLQSTFQPPCSRMTSAPRNSSPMRLDGFLQQDALAVDGDVAEALVVRRAGAVGGVGGGGEPALVDAAAVRAERVEIARIELQTAARHQERSRHPAGRKPHDALARGQGVVQQGCVGHLLVGRRFLENRVHERTAHLHFRLHLQHDRLGGIRILLAAGARFDIARHVDRLFDGSCIR